MNIEETQKINKLARELQASKLTNSSKEAMEMAQAMITRRVSPEHVENEEAKHDTHHANMDESISNLSSEVHQLATVVTNLKEAYSKMISEVDNMRIKAAQTAQAAQQAQEAHALQAAKAVKAAQAAQAASEEAAAQKPEQTPKNTQAETIETSADTTSNDENDKKGFSPEDVAIEKVFYFGQK
jgi:hypothetical protein